ncbi:MAG: ABC transporter permease, partial [Methanomassiliicoccaceae archaeon]|nr:ABC transporter permease [Methanomassiliicoccaceae archaeon]
MLGDNFSDNMRQTGVIVKYELKKQFRGKRIAIFAVIMVLLLALCTILPYAFGDGLSALSPNELARLYMGSMVQLYVILLATLFFASIIVSEFEERTALILFTKPLKKWSVFLGKISAALLIGFAFILIFYAVTAVISLIALGTVTSALLKSLGLALICMVGLGGI